MVFLERGYQPFDTFLHGRYVRTLWRAPRGSDFSISKHSATPGERPKVHSKRHLLGMWCGGGNCAAPDERGMNVACLKSSARFALFPAGILPAVQRSSPGEFVICQFDSGFVQGVQDELEGQPAGSLRMQIAFHDPAIRDLVKLLSKDAVQGAPFGVLYTDQLVRALAIRMLYLEVEVRPTPRIVNSGLPRHALKRVLERMHHFDEELNLKSLAAETGYSRGYFLRMFRLATGQTPHRYLAQLKVNKAQQLLQDGRMSLIEIAFACGFSSHPHMSKVFRHLTGHSPSDFRRQTSKR
jgi:AraC family transcriptional regulator